jgi:hypothetical protein
MSAGMLNADDELSSETYDAHANVLSTGGKAFAYDSEPRDVDERRGAVVLRQ